GTDITGTLALGNTLSGICEPSTPGGSATIGGRNPGEGNVIAFSGTNGMTLAGSNWTIVGNSMFSNHGLGLWLNDACGTTASPTPNDPGDGDTGGNQLQNFPIVKAVNHLSPETSGTEVVGKLDSTPSTDFTLDFYADPACSNFPREFLQGKTYLGSAPLST